MHSERGELIVPGGAAVANTLRLTTQVAVRSGLPNVRAHRDNEPREAGRRASTCSAPAMRIDRPVVAKCPLDFDGRGQCPKQVLKLKDGLRTLCHGLADEAADSEHHAVEHVEVLRARNVTIDGVTIVDVKGCIGPCCLLECIQELSQSGLESGW